MTIKQGFNPDGSRLTPAQAAGFIQDVTKLKLVNNGPNGNRYSNFSNLSEKVWVLEVDDGSNCPYFRALDGTRDSMCAYVTDFKVVEAETVKFPVGTRVEVIASGWGFGPEHIGKTYTVKSVAIRANDYTIYKVECGETGQVMSGEIWEPAFKLAAPLIPPAPATLSATLPTAGVIQVPNYTATQRLALNTFQAMYDAAVAHREGRATTINYGYGICDNIERYAESAGTTARAMSEVKENLIRQTPSYSGEYHYPVPCPNGGAAHSAFSRQSDKWSDAYGLNRLQQLAELIELIKTKWNDNLVNRQTPATRNNLKIGDLVAWTQRAGQAPTFWVFQYDDESMSPAFHKLGEPDSRRDIDLSEVKKLSADQCKDRSVSEFLEVLKAAEDKKVALEAQLAALQAAIAEVNGEIALLDFGLASQHKVKRI